MLMKNILLNKMEKSLNLEDMNLCIESSGYYFHVEKGQFLTDVKDAHTESNAEGALTFENKKVESGKLTART